MMGCGVAPRGSLKLAHLAAKLTPSISGGPHMPVSCHSAFCLLFLHAAAGRWLRLSECTAEYCCCLLPLHTVIHTSARKYVCIAVLLQVLQCMSGTFWVLPGNSNKHCCQGKTPLCTLSCQSSSSFCCQCKQVASMKCKWLSSHTSGSPLHVSCCHYIPRLLTAGLAILQLWLLLP